MIFREGDIGHEFFIIIKGKYGVYKEKDLESPGFSPDKINKSLFNLKLS